MSYSIMGTGRMHRNQAQAVMTSLANQEQQRNATNEQLSAAEDASRAQSVGTLAGMGFEKDIERYYDSVKAAEEAEAAAALGDPGAAVASEAVGAGTVDGAVAGGAEAVTAAGTAEAAGAATLAGEAAVTGEAVAGAATAAQATTATSAAAGAGATATGGAAGGAKAGATMGPWGALIGAGIGLLATSLF